MITAMAMPSLPGWNREVRRTVGSVHLAEHRSRAEHLTERQVYGGPRQPWKAIQSQEHGWDGWKDPTNTITELMILVRNFTYVDHLLDQKTEYIYNNSFRNNRNRGSDLVTFSGISLHQLRTKRRGGQYPRDSEGPVSKRREELAREELLGPSDETLRLLRPIQMDGGNFMQRTPVVLAVSV